MRRFFVRKVGFIFFVFFFSLYYFLVIFFRFIILLYFFFDLLFFSNFFFDLLRSIFFVIILDLLFFWNIFFALLFYCIFLSLYLFIYFFRSIIFLKRQIHAPRGPWTAHLRYYCPLLVSITSQSCLSQQPVVARNTSLLFWFLYQSYIKHENKYRTKAILSYYPWTPFKRDFAAKSHGVKEEIGAAGAARSAVDGSAKAKGKAAAEVDGLPKEELSFDQGLRRMRPGKIGKVNMLDAWLAGWRVCLGTRVLFHMARLLSLWL